jgi:hypothetical protein
VSLKQARETSHTLPLLPGIDFMFLALGKLKGEKMHIILRFGAFALDAKGKFSTTDVIRSTLREHGPSTLSKSSMLSLSFLLLP